MKKLYAFLLTFSSLLALAQVPQKINYQGIARHSDGSPITTNISLKFEILASPAATVAFTETHASVAVSALGLFNEQIGSGTPLPTTWTNTPYALRVSIDSTGNNASYLVLGSQELVSVPFALSAAPPSVTLDPVTSVLSVGGNTVQLPTPAGLQNLIALPNGSIAISNGNTVTIAPPTFTATGGGVSITQNGYGYTVNSPSVSLYGGVAVPYPPFALPSGLVQIMGSYPNYSVIATPSINYSQSTGSLILSSYPNTTPAYSFSYYTTPALNFTPATKVLSVGPSLNSYNLAPWMPWNCTSAPDVTLASQNYEVGIGTFTPNTSLHVDGFTRLGVTAPAMQVMSFMATTAASPSSATVITLPSYTLQGAPSVGITTSNVISVNVMVQESSGNNWVHENNTALTNTVFNWHLNSTNGIVITNLVNSSNILSRPVKITITYTP